MSMFNGGPRNEPRPPRPPRPPMPRPEMDSREMPRVKPRQGRGGTQPVPMPDGREFMERITGGRNTRPAPMPDGREFMDRVTGGRRTNPAPMPDSRVSSLSESARQTDLPRVNKAVTDDEYNFYIQNIDRPSNPSAVNKKISDISRRLQTEQSFVNKYIDQPYLNPTQEDRANDAMVNAILSRMDRFGGR